MVKLLHHFVTWRADFSSLFYLDLLFSGTHNDTNERMRSREGKQISSESEKSTHAANAEVEVDANCACCFSLAAATKNGNREMCVKV